MNKKTRTLTVGGIFIAIATVLSVLTIYRLPYGGSITPLSMLPIVMLAYKYGIRRGLICGLAYGIIQAIFGAAVSSAFAGQGVGAIIGILFFDYIAAFCSLGLAGMFKKRIKNPTVAFALGTCLACVLRYICHIVSGCIFFGSYAEWFFTQESVSFGADILSKYNGFPLILIYSSIYNGTFMIPEIIMTTVAATIVISAAKPLRRELTAQD